jgi:tRNA A-37 threonylcarbamoyl transferase component Bud32
MAVTRTERPTDSEYDDSERDRDSTAQPASTMRVGTEDTATLRLGSGDGPEALNPAAWRGRYDEQGEIARGGMSSIVAAIDRVLKRRVAMKVLDRKRDPDGLGFFVQEARVTAALDHPNIVPVHDLHHDEDGWPSRFTMKLVEGETLAAILERTPSEAMHGVTLERILEVLLKVCDAVAFAHSRGVIHCDLKPANVMVGSHGQVYLMDWGVAQRRAHPEKDPADRATLELSDTLLSGTPAYMAPEQAWGRSEEIDERTDVYGLGGLLYALLTHAPPHDGGKLARDLALAKEGLVPHPQDTVTDHRLPPGLCRIAMRALAPSQADRYQNVAEMRGDIERFIRGGGWFEAVHIAQGTLIVREGDAPDAAYIVTEGQCELFRIVDGEKHFMRLLGPGECFGETSIFGSSARTASISASSDVTLLKVTREALERELERSDWLRSFVEALAERFIELDQKVRRLEGR